MDPFNDENRLQINIAICGAVSAGKSTLLNSLFVSQYSDMKIKRTTMTPQVYYENNELNKIDSKVIRQENKVINDNFIKKTENQEAISINDIKENKYIVPKVHKLLELKNNVFLTIYDIPGLNDGRTKDVYFQYLNSNFYKFDIIMFIVDIYSSLNTSDEVDILETLIKNAKKNYDDYGIHNKLIVLANKCDDLFLGNNQELKLDDELEEMYQQIEKVVQQKVEAHFKDLEYSILPISSEDSFIYRMYDRNPEYGLDIKHINKFGFNEYGKSRWNKLTDISKKTKIKSLMKDINIEETLYLTGFSNFKKQLQYNLNEENQYKYLLNHILYGLKQLTGNTVLNIKDDINKFYKYYQILEQLNSSFNLPNTKPFKKILDQYLEKYQQNIINKYIESDASIKSNNEGYLPMINQIKEISDMMSQLFIGYCKVDEINKLVTDCLNKYYISNIKQGSKPVSTIFNYLTNLFKYGYKITLELIENFFSNNDMIVSKTSAEIIQYIEDLESRKIIQSKDKVEILMKIMTQVYAKLAQGQLAMKLDQTLVLQYTYLINMFWFNKLKTNVDKEYLYLGMLATKSQQVWFNTAVPCQLMHGEVKDILILESYLYTLINTTHEIPESNTVLISSDGDSLSDELDRELGLNNSVNLGSN